MQIHSVSKKRGIQKRNEIRLGYVRLLDAAPIIIGEALGYFTEVGLDVRLEKQIGWATIRDKVAFGELDVAQALGPMPIAMRLGIGVSPSEVIAGMILNRNGNAITLSESLWESGIRDGTSLRRYVKQSDSHRKLIFGTVSLTSSHYIILCRWLQENGIDPRKDVIISVLPPEQMVRNLSSGNIDGFSVGEPWNSIAIEQGIGWCPVTSEEILSGYPEKVLIAHERFASYRPDSFNLLMVGLIKACEYCSSPYNAAHVSEILSAKNYLNCSYELLLNVLQGNFHKGHGIYTEGSNFIEFESEQGNLPDIQSGTYLYDDLRRFLPDFKGSSSRMVLIKSIFREDLFEKAKSTAKNLSILTI